MKRSGMRNLQGEYVEALSPKKEVSWVSAKDGEELFSRSASWRRVISLNFIDINDFLAIFKQHLYFYLGTNLLIHP